MNLHACACLASYPGRGSSTVAPFQSQSNHQPHYPNPKRQTVYFFSSVDSLSVFQVPGPYLNTDKVRHLGASSPQPSTVCRRGVTLAVIGRSGVCLCGAIARVPPAHVFFLSSLSCLAFARCRDQACCPCTVSIGGGQEEDAPPKAIGPLLHQTLASIWECQKSKGLQGPCSYSLFAVHGYGSPAREIPVTIPHPSPSLVTSPPPSQTSAELSNLEGPSSVLSALALPYPSYGYPPPTPLLLWRFHRPINWSPHWAGQVPGL